jgi:acyl-CoA thioester hydrolase
LCSSPCPKLAYERSKGLSKTAFKIRRKQPDEIGGLDPTTLSGAQGPDSVLLCTQSQAPNESNGSWVIGLDWNGRPVNSSAEGSASVARDALWYNAAVMLEGLPTGWTSSTLRVRYAETDCMGIVYYANFFVWFEIGRTDFCRAHHFLYRDMEQQDGLYIMVAETRCRYKAPARYDDQITVRTRLTALRRRVLVFGYEVIREPDEELLAEGETVHVITDREGHPRALPEKYHRLFLSQAPSPGDGAPGERKPIPSVKS